MLTVLKEAAKANRVQTILIAWFVPVVLGVYAFMITVLPAVRDTAVVRQFGLATQILGVNKFLFVVIASLALATFMYINRTFLYKVLEGELWPRGLREWRRRRAHIPQHRYLLAKQQHNRAQRAAEQARATVQELADAGAGSTALTDATAKLGGAETNLSTARDRLASADHERQNRGRQRRYPGILARLPRRHRPLWTPSESTRPEEPDWIPTYPATEAQVMATRVGNELKAMETYGANTYGLDSQTLWYELYSDAPEPLRASIDDAELQADTFVCSLYVAMTFFAATSLATIWKTTQAGFPIALWIVTAASAISMAILHRGLLASIEEWSATIQALVNNGRMTLAEKYSLHLPQNSDHEREMWDALTGFVYYGGAKYYANKLDAFKKDPTPGTAQTGSPTP